MRCAQQEPQLPRLVLPARPVVLARLDQQCVHEGHGRSCTQLRQGLCGVHQASGGQGRQQLLRQVGDPRHPLPVRPGALYDNLPYSPYQIVRLGRQRRQHRLPHQALGQLEE